jgi:hypothetical protein
MATTLAGVIVWASSSHEFMKRDHHYLGEGVSRF